MEQARNFDRAGQEAPCMDAIARAKQFSVSDHAQIPPATEGLRRERRTNRAPPDRADKAAAIAKYKTLRDWPRPPKGLPHATSPSIPHRARP